MIVGRCLPVRQNESGTWQVEHSPGLWQDTRSKEEARLLSRAIPLSFESDPDQEEVEEVLAGLNRIGFYENHLIYRRVLAKRR